MTARSAALAELGISVRIPAKTTTEVSTLGQHSHPSKCFISCDPSVLLPCGRRGVNCLHCSPYSVLNETHSMRREHARGPTACMPSAPPVHIGAPAVHRGASVVQRSPPPVQRSPPVVQRGAPLVCCTVHVCEPSPAINVITTGVASWLTLVRTPALLETIMFRNTVLLLVCSSYFYSIFTTCTAKYYPTDLGGPLEFSTHKHFYFLLYYCKTCDIELMTVSMFITFVFNFV